MENIRISKTRKQRNGKVWQFVSMPFFVLNSSSYVSLSNAAKALLIEVALQYNGKNNGDLTVNFTALEKRGWTSRSGVTKARDELIEHGFIQETRKGCKGGRVGLYAITWQSLDFMDKYEISLSGFNKNAFLGQCMAKKN